MEKLEVFMSTEQYRKQKMIPRRDFIYLCIILIITLIAVVTLTLGDSSRAGENLNFAATLTSIILADLAIVISLVDASGQKESIKDLREASDSINNSVENVKSVLDKTREQLQEVLVLRDEIIEKSQLNISEFKTEFIIEIKKMIEESNGQNISMDDLEKLIKSLKDKEIKFDTTTSIPMWIVNNESLDIDVMFGTDKELETHINNIFGYKNTPEADLINELIKLYTKDLSNTDLSNKYLIKKARAKINKMVRHRVLHRATNNSNEVSYFTLPF